MAFVRVKSKGGPDAEFYVGEEEAKVNADLYDVIDAEPVDDIPHPIPEERVDEVAEVPKRAPKSTATEVAPETSVGDNNKEII